MVSYKISAALHGHEDDVRGVLFPSPDSILSASRDATVRHWKLISSTPPRYEDSIVHQGSAFVNAIAYIPPTTEFPEGLIISGGKEAIIDIRQPGRPPDANAERLLLGHEGNICALDTFRDSKNSYLVSGSWDSSARIWNINKGESTSILEGHGGSVWAVLAYDAERVITGCADQQIRIFNPNGKLLKSFNGGNDVVRTLCKLPSTAPAQIASAGNEAIIRLWTLEGVEISQLRGHESFIYSLAVHPNGELISSSEDRTVRIWQGSQCIQTITHPAISVWSISCCAETGDIVSGASDRVVRVFSRVKERQADKQTLDAFEDSIKSSSIPQQQMGDINKEKLPGPEFLREKSGTKEGQVQMIREANGGVTAHQWSSAANQWLHVGTVVDAAGSSGRKQEYMGKDYDYVFDVDIEDGKPPLRLPFNLSQNPYEVAQKFIADNELPISYIDQVADFIIRNTQGTTIGQSSSTSRSAATDPWGQESRYRPGDASDTPSSQTRSNVLPQTEYLTIATANFVMIRKKIDELNEKLKSEGRKDISLNPSGMQVLSNACSLLESGSSTNTKPNALDSGVDLAMRICTQWPPANQLPGLDLLRCLAAFVPSITLYEPLTVVHASINQSHSPNANLIMLSVRLLANIFAHTEGRQWAFQHFDRIYELVKPTLQPSLSGTVLNRNVHIATMTLYINYAVLFASSNEGVVAARSRILLEDIISVLDNGKIVDSETTYRTLVAAGTLLIVPGVEKPSLELRKAVTKAEKAAKEPRIKNVAAELMALI